jgi:hypothetical protein
MDRKDDWLAARAYPLEGIKKNKLDTALGYFENKPPACTCLAVAARGP